MQVQNNTNQTVNSYSQNPAFNKDNILDSLTKLYTNVNISSNMKPFSGVSGKVNVAIAPNILNQMANDPEKMKEYVQLINDMQKIGEDTLGKTYLGHRIVAVGFMINADGTGGMWTMQIRSDGSKDKAHENNLPKDKKETWLDILLKQFKDSNPTEDTSNSNISSESIDIKA